MANDLMGYLIGEVEAVIINHRSKKTMLNVCQVLGPSYTRVKTATIRGAFKKF